MLGGKGLMYERERERERVSVWECHIPRNKSYQYHVAFMFVACYIEYAESDFSEMSFESGFMPVMKSWMYPRSHFKLKLIKDT